ncbi:stage VI sporulation protein D [Halalkalibacter kiskunsagensis]|uniref:Stage VI sporulation protein D n=1 Tax=Halalkalibacter kiskunsagensis TaxID=1548599 RepID=A0ABV6K801_9BACI
MTEHPSKLSFSIEESVWLNKGQEVEEILGMSLEPEIVIEEKDLHVYIKGGLRLVGEYRPTGSAEAVDVDSESLEAQLSFRSAGDVTISDDGTGEIKHFFPIDVTIPTSRIQNLDDVYVQVESFDYDLPEKSCIQLTADISISGMTQQQDSVEKRVEQEIEKEAVKAEPPKLGAVPTAFAFEAKKRPEIGAMIPNVPGSYPARPFHPVSEESPESVEEKVEEKTPAIAASPSTKYTRKEEEVANVSSDAPRYEPVASEARDIEEVDNTEDIEDVEEVEIEQEAPTESVELVAEDTVEEVREEAPAKPETKINLAPLKEMAVAPSLEERPEEKADEEEAPPPREENALYLTSMLSKGEERFSKWKMCIIQENESLDTIADRYDISTSQLVRMNRLQGEQVEEGQILYIPVSVES